MKVSDIDVHAHREPDHEIEPLFVERWSPRAMNGEPVARGDLMRLFEAARWAPSGFNRQPWRFVYALRDSEAWPSFFDLLVEFNQGWCRQAGALVVIAARTVSESGNPIQSHAFDTGAAWQNLALQGSRMGLVVHGMAGFDHERAAELIGAGEGVAIQAMCAVGHPGERDSLPDELREKETPSPRNAVSDFAFEGSL